MLIKSDVLFDVSPEDFNSNSIFGFSVDPPFDEALVSFSCCKITVLAKDGPILAGKSALISSNKLSI